MTGWPHLRFRRRHGSDVRACVASQGHELGEDHLHPPRAEGPAAHRRHAGGCRLGGAGLQGVWTLYWPDRHSKFHRYEDLEPTPTVDRLLVEIDSDPICIFWG